MRASQHYRPHNSMVTAVQQNALFSILLKTIKVQVLVPSRYASYVTATSDGNTKKIDDFMATTCQALPSMAFIDCSTLKRHIQGELLRKVKHILLRCHISKELRSKNGAQPISPAVMNQLRPLLHHGSKLQNITLGECTDEVIHYITSQVAELFTSNTDHTIRMVSISVSDGGWSWIWVLWSFLDLSIPCTGRKKPESLKKTGINDPSHLITAHTQVEELVENIFGTFSSRPHESS